jgi:hypothetical protein
MDLQATAMPQEQAAADEADVFEPAEGELAPGIVTEPFAVVSTLPPMEAEDFARTLTMADLYAGQGLIDEARDIYEDILARDPNNATVRAKLDALSTGPGAAPEPPLDEGPWEEEEPAAEMHAPPAVESAPAAPEPEKPAEGRSADPKVEKLSGWLERVKRGDGRV